MLSGRCLCPPPTSSHRSVALHTTDAPLVLKHTRKEEKLIRFSCFLDAKDGGQLMQGKWKSPASFPEAGQSILPIMALCQHLAMRQCTKQCRVIIVLSVRLLRKQVYWYLVNIGFSPVFKWVFRISCGRTHAPQWTQRWFSLMFFFGLRGVLFLACIMYVEASWERILKCRLLSIDCKWKLRWLISAAETKHGHSTWSEMNPTQNPGCTQEAGADSVTALCHAVWEHIPHQLVLMFFELS